MMRRMGLGEPVSRRSVISIGYRASRPSPTRAPAADLITGVRSTPNGSQNIAAGSNGLNWCPGLGGPAEASALRA